MAKPAVEFAASGAKLLLIYRPRDDPSWVHERFAAGAPLVIKGTFHLTKAHLLKGKAKLDSDDFWQDDLRFVVASAKRDYFVFNPAVLPVGVPVLLSRQARPTWKWFSAEEKVSVLGLAAELKPSRIVIGGLAKDAIPISEYERLVAQFPTSYELKLYVLSRLAVVFREHADAKLDAEAKLRKYVAKRVTAKPKDLIAPLRQFEVAKYEFLLAQLTKMLDAENGYPERQWQDQILDIVRILNPKYIAAFTSAWIRDTDTTGKRRQLDILLVDVSGHVDFIEIKQPFGKRVVTETVYRGNHVPHRELSGTVAQVEKYLYHLGRWGKAGEEELSLRYKARLPAGLKIRIVNPCGMVIMGRDHDLTEVQRGDFEIFRRQNKNIVDVITYDDLLRRLDIVLKQLKAGH
jgi:hypothetical protein